MGLFRFAPILVVFLLLSAGQVSLLPGQAYAACCRSGYCFWFCQCGCSSRVQACVDQLLGGENFTIKTKRSGPVELIADKDVLNQLLDLRGKGGELVCGTYTLRLFGNVENMKLKCTKFEPGELGSPSSKEDKEVEGMTLEFEEAIAARSDPKSISKFMKE